MVLHLATRIASEVLGFLKIGSVIRQGNKLKTPVLYLEHPTTRRRIILIGVMHIGERKYYEELQLLIDTFPKYKILYEGIGKLSPGEWEKLTEKERHIYSCIIESIKTTSLLTMLLNIQGQREGLRYDSQWIRTDMSMFEFIRKVSAYNIASIFPKTQISFDKKGDAVDKALTAWICDIIIMRASFLVIVMNIIGFFSTKCKKSNKLLLDERNAIALEAIFRESKSADIVSIWGAEHLKGMLKVLKRAGYVKKDKHWIVCYETNNKNYFTNLLVALETETKK
jgi:hypothetical protein